MRFRSIVSTALLLFVALPGLSSCGAGLITGIVAGGDRGSTPAASAPALTAVNPTAPLARSSTQGRFLLVNSFEAPANADVRVELRALGAVSQQDVVLVSTNASANSTSILFAERYQEIIKVLGGDLTTSDVFCQLFLFVDGEQVGSAVPFTLIRQRTAELIPESPDDDDTFVSVLGNSRIRVKVSGRPDETTLDAPTLLVSVPNTEEPQPATGIQVSRIAGTFDWEVSGIAPPNAFPTRINVVVEDNLAGLSSLVPNVFYRPAILAASPGFGSINGGTKIFLFGQGLVPLNKAGDPTSTDFSRVSIEFHKGGRSLTVPPTSVREGESGLTQLVFFVPPTPDGRPGRSKVVVKIDLGAVEVTDEKEDVFAYRRPNPNFGPRGALLTDVPLSLQPARIDAGPQAAPDFALLSSVGGMPRVELIVAEQNGMFSSFGPPYEAGNQLDPSQRDPSDLCVGDFDADGDADLMVVNGADSSANFARHTVLVTDQPQAPLALASGGIRDDETGSTFCLSGDLDGDSVTDTVLLPRAGSSARPRVVLARPVAGQLGFDPVQLIPGLISTRGPFDVANIGDLDGDGALDLFCVAGGATMVLVTAFGDGNGSFTDQREVTITMPATYTPDAASPAVGVHHIDGAAERPVVVIFAGLDASAVTPPTVAVLRPTGRDYASPAATDVIGFTTIKPFATSAYGDLSGDAPGELVVAGVEGSDPELRLFQWSVPLPPAVPFLSEIPNAFASALESTGTIRCVSIGLGVSEDPPRVTAPIQAVFVHHSLATNEERISTWLAAPGPILTPPDASVILNRRVRGTALGNFSGQALDPPRAAKAHDLIVATPTLLEILANDGVGGFSRDSAYSVTSPVSGTLSTIELTAQGADGVACLLADGQLATLRPGDSSVLTSGDDLRIHAPTVAGWNVSPFSCIRSSDVNADGFADLVVSLVLEDPASSGNYNSVLLLLVGKAIVDPGEFPFHLPDAGVPTALITEKATSVAIADFDTGGPNLVREVALALPTDANHVRFHRYDDGGTPTDPTDDRMVESAPPGLRGLIAGDQPTQIAAADFDGNGTLDLAVASSGDSKVRVFANSGALHGSGEVNVSAFMEGQSVAAIPAGEPTAMLLGDLDGDEVDDVVVATMDDSSGQKDHSVAIFINSGTGALSGLRILDDTRTGNETAPAQLRNVDMYPAMADVNWDRMPDLIMGWNSAGAVDRNIRVLFGSGR